MKSQIESRPVFQKILYSQAWEDPQADLDGLRPGPDDDMLAIGASGDNPLAFLLARPRSVTALDFNACQNHLLELKLSAIEALDPPDVHRFLGVTPWERREVYYRLVRDALSPLAREYWDANQPLIDRGVIHVGRFEGYLNTFRRYVLPLVHRRRTIEQIFALRSREEAREFHDRRWDGLRWRMLFRAFFGETVMGKLGRDPAFFKYVEGGSVGERFRRRFEHAITDMPTRDNWFLEYMLLGGYHQPDLRLPPYLRPENHAFLRKEGRARLKIVRGSFEEFLPAQQDGAFSCFYLSDIFEWMSADAFLRLLREFVRVARDGARLTWRNLLVPRGHPPEMQGTLVHEAELSRAIHARDRSFVYGDFVVERVVKSPPAAAGPRALPRAGGAT